MERTATMQVKQHTRPAMGVQAPAGETLAVPAEIAEALHQWIRRAYVEIRYLPSNSDQRKHLVQAAYVAETLIRATHDGEVFLPSPLMTYAAIARLMVMIELNQDIRFSEMRQSELELVRLWLSRWRASMDSRAGTTSSRPAGQSSADKQHHMTSLSRLYTNLTLGLVLLALPAAIPAFPPDPAALRTDPVSSPAMPRPDTAGVSPLQAPAVSPRRPNAHRRVSIRRPVVRSPGKRTTPPMPANARSRPAHLAPSLF